VNANHLPLLRSVSKVGRPGYAPRLFKSEAASFTVQANLYPAPDRDRARISAGDYVMAQVGHRDVAV
jgi:hypothetical protein